MGPAESSPSEMGHEPLAVVRLRFASATTQVEVAGVLLTKRLITRIRPDALADGPEAVRHTDERIGARHARKL
jgi:hypothetical protein